MCRGVANHFDCGDGCQTPFAVKLAQNFPTLKKKAFRFQDLGEIGQEIFEFPDIKKSSC